MFLSCDIGVGVGVGMIAWFWSSWWRYNDSFSIDDCSGSSEESRRLNLRKRGRVKVGKDIFSVSEWKTNCRYCVCMYLCIYVCVGWAINEWALRRRTMLEFGWSWLRNAGFGSPSRQVSIIWTVIPALPVLPLLLAQISLIWTVALASPVSPLAVAFLQMTSISHNCF